MKLSVDRRGLGLFRLFLDWGITGELNLHFWIDPEWRVLPYGGWGFEKDHYDGVPNWTIKCGRFLVIAWMEDCK